MTTIDTPTVAPGHGAAMRAPTATGADGIWAVVADAAILGLPP